MVVGAVLALASPPGAARVNTFGGLVPSTITDYDDSLDIPIGQHQTVAARCPAGMLAVGGGGAEVSGLALGPDVASAVVTARTLSTETDRSVGVWPAACRVCGWRARRSSPANHTPGAKGLRACRGD
jgi:hypothetical protein